MGLCFKIMTSAAFWRTDCCRVRGGKDGKTGESGQRWSGPEVTVAGTRQREKAGRVWKICRPNLAEGLMCIDLWGQMMGREKTK